MPSRVGPVALLPDGGTLGAVLTIQWLTLRLDIRGSLTLFDRTCAFWALTTGSTAIGTDPTVLEPGRGTSYLSVQKIGDDAEPSASAGETNGLCALGIVLAPSSSLEQAKDEALAWGSTPIPGPPSPEHDVVRLKSPGGYVFSLTIGSDSEVVVPAAAELGTGGLSRADQVCLDVPPTEFDSECVFWQALTGWLLTSQADSEFAHLLRPSDIPIRILLQRRDDAEPGDVVTGHLDFSTEDRKSLAAEHIRAGATLVDEYPGWITLRDPAGRTYCLTAREVV